MNLRPTGVRTSCPCDVRKLEPEKTVQVAMGQQQRRTKPLSSTLLSNVVPLVNVRLGGRLGMSSY